MEGLSWWQLLCGFFHVLMDIFLQKIRCAHLPKRLPLQPLPNFSVIVTGATGGIGLETARELAKVGAHVILLVRNTIAGEKLVEEWVRDQKATGGPSINAEVMELNLLSLASVRTFAKQWADRELPLQVLINNAGIFAMGVKQRFSEDGYEHHLQVNHLGHALLSMLLLPSLIHGAPSRIINVSSNMHYLGFVNPEDMNITKRKFHSMIAYGGSKLAQLLFSHALQMWLPKEAGVDVIAVHPGEVMTNVTRDLPLFLREAEKISAVVRLSPLEGARSVLFCATDLQVYQYVRALREMGCPVAPYFSSDCKPAKVSQQANDLECAKKVWSKTLELVGLREDYLDRVLGNKTFSDPVDENQQT